MKQIIFMNTVQSKEIMFRREDDLTARNTHKANTEVYHPDDVIVDLLDLAARVLVMGGRIGYLFPILGT